MPAADVDPTPGSSTGRRCLITGRQRDPARSWANPTLPPALPEYRSRQLLVLVQRNQLGPRHHHADDAAVPPLQLDKVEAQKSVQVRVRVAAQVAARQLR